MNTKETVYVGLSGGVDSSVAALRLIRAGYHVVGVFIKVWQPDFLECHWEEERLDAMRVAAKLRIPFHTFDATEIYKHEVVDYLIGEYKAGRTPNPDTMCNQHVKFGAFLKYARQARADKIATGHYAQIKKQEDTYELHRGSDVQKDQSYFLWTLKQEELAHTLFPVGDTPKKAIRKEAKRFGLHTAQKKDSQGVCFLGQLDMEAFLSHYIPKEQGAVYAENGTHIGTHNGAWLYTIGQRHGITYFNKNTESQPQYVSRKDMENNALFVSPEPPVRKGATLLLSAVNNMSSMLTPGSTVEAVLRYRGQPQSCVVTSITTDSLTLSFSETLSAPTTGQSCVLYTGTQCLGGGIIEDITA